MLHSSFSRYGTLSKRLCAGLNTNTHTMGKPELADLIERRRNFFFLEGPAGRVGALMRTWAGGHNDLTITTYAYTKEVEAAERENRGVDLSRGEKIEERPGPTQGFRRRTMSLAVSRLPRGIMSKKR